MRKIIQLLALAFILGSPGLAQAGGPLVLMGIDAEDCGPGGHGPITVYESVATDILSNVTKPAASGILVIGGDANCIQPFWNQLATDIGETITFVSGASISTQAFSSFALIGIASDFQNTFGGLTDADNTLLTARAADIASHVNAGGGLLGFSSCALQVPYGYLGGAVTCGVVGENNITPTPDGTAIGITDALDVCCWHDNYTTFPSFLNVLATYPNVSNTAAALGGAEVVVPGFVLTPSTATNEVGTSHTVTITVSQTTGGVTSPVPGVTVNFTVSGVNTGSGSCVTDANGQCTFSYTGTNGGTDTITATANVAGQAQTATATKDWTLPLNVEVPFDIKPTSCRNPLNAKEPGGGEKAVLPAAILGTATFDVTQIDLASVRLEGVSAIRSSLEDVATPFVPFIGKSKPTDCTTAGPDGFLDLTLKFNRQAVVNALGGPGALTDGQVVVLHVTANLLDGTPIVGEDVVVILKKK